MAEAEAAKAAAGAAAAAAAATAKEDVASSDVMDRLETEYFAQAKKGVILTAEELREFCEKKKLLPCPPLAELRRLRHRFKYIAIHSRWRKPPAYVGSSIEKLGIIFIDVGLFHRDLRVANKQCYVLLVAQDLLSQKLGVLAYPNKSQESWSRGIDFFVREWFPCVSAFVSDRDSSISGKPYQQSLRDKYGIQWIHLRNR
jgi:hypothetical protein